MLPYDSDDDSLCARAAWLHYGGGLTQAQVAERLNVTNAKAHRLIARANRLGYVHISMEGNVAECVALEERIAAEYGLEFCQVAPDLGEEPIPLRTLGLAGARYLTHAFSLGDHAIIGFGHGRTIAAVANRLPPTSMSDVKLVSLLGGLTRRFAATPFDVMYRLAERTGAEAYVLPVPMYANSSEDRQVLLEQRGVDLAFKMGLASTLRIVGIGAMEPDGSILSVGMVEKEVFDEAKRQGGVGEVLGHIVDRSGKLLENELSSRTLSMSAADIRALKTVAIAGGRFKVEAIGAVLASGLLSGLITDERTAADLLERKHTSPPSRTLAKDAHRLRR